MLLSHQPECRNSRFWSPTALQVVEVATSEMTTSCSTAFLEEMAGNSDFKIKAGLLAFLFFPVVAQKTTKPLKTFPKNYIDKCVHQWKWRKIASEQFRNPFRSTSKTKSTLFKKTKEVITTKAKYAFHNCKSSTRQLQVRDKSRHWMRSITVSRGVTRGRFILYPGNKIQEFSPSIKYFYQTKYKLQVIYCNEYRNTYIGFDE